MCVTILFYLIFSSVFMKAGTESDSGNKVGVFILFVLIFSQWMNDRIWNVDCDGRKALIKG